MFEYIPIEHLIKNRQEEYYKALSISDKQGSSTTFIEYMLTIINEAIKVLLDTTNIQDSFKLRIKKAKEYFLDKQFSRIDFMKLHKTISSAKASRDLKKAVDLKLIIKQGDKRTTTYTFN